MSFRSSSAGVWALAAALWGASPAHALIGGTDTTSFNAVGALNGASGVLVAGNWVLTAAHVASSLTVGSSVFESLVGHSLVDAVYRFSSEAYPGNDIALVHLGTSLKAALPVLNDVIVRPNQVGAIGSVTQVTAQTQVPNGVGTSTAASVQTTYEDTATGITSTVNWLITQGGSTVESGDSGGALFKGLVNDSGNALLLGLGASQLTLNDGRQESAFVQVANYKNWIDSVMANSGQHVAWASTVPEPASFMLFALGVLAILARTLDNSAKMARMKASNA